MVRYDLTGASCPKQSCLSQLLHQMLSRPLCLPALGRDALLIAFRRRV